MGNQAVWRTLSLPFLRLHAGGEADQTLPWKEAREEQKVTSHAWDKGDRGGHRESLLATVWDQCPSKKVVRTQGEGANLWVPHTSQSLVYLVHPEARRKLPKGTISWTLHFSWVNQGVKHLPG